MAAWNHLLSPCEIACEHFWGVISFTVVKILNILKHYFSTFFTLVMLIMFHAFMLFAKKFCKFVNSTHFPLPLL